MKPLTGKLFIVLNDLSPCHYFIIRIGLEGSCLSFVLENAFFKPTLCSRHKCHSHDCFATLVVIDFLSISETRIIVGKGGLVH